MRIKKKHNKGPGEASHYLFACFLQFRVCPERSGQPPPELEWSRATFLQESRFSWMCVGRSRNGVWSSAKAQTLLHASRGQKTRRRRDERKKAKRESALSPSAPRPAPLCSARGGRRPKAKVGARSPRAVAPIGDRAPRRAKSEQRAAREERERSCARAASESGRGRGRLSRCSLLSRASESFPESRKSSSAGSLQSSTVLRGHDATIVSPSGP